jgi:hypothetical protein
MKNKFSNLPSVSNLEDNDIIPISRKNAYDEYSNYSINGFTINNLLSAGRITNIEEIATNYASNSSSFISSSIASTVFSGISSNILTISGDQEINGIKYFHNDIKVDGDILQNNGNSQQWNSTYSYFSQISSFVNVLSTNSTIWNQAVNTIDGCVKSDTTLAPQATAVKNILLLSESYYNTLLNNNLIDPHTVYIIQ